MAAESLDGVALHAWSTWSLVWRRGEERAAVLAAVDALAGVVGDLGIHSPDAYRPLVLQQGQTGTRVPARALTGATGRSEARR